LEGDWIRSQSLENTISANSASSFNLCLHFGSFGLVVKETSKEHIESIHFLREELRQWGKCTFFVSLCRLPCAVLHLLFGTPTCLIPLSLPLQPKQS
jgi:hypothetical protein